MSAHLEALEGHLDVILDPSLEPNTQSMDGDFDVVSAADGFRTHSRVDRTASTVL